MSSLSQLMLSSVEVIKHVSVMLLNIKQMFVKLLQTEIHLFNLIYFSLCFCRRINVYNIFQLWSSLTHSNMYNSVFLYNSYVEFCQHFWKFCSFLIQSCCEIRKFHSLESLRSTPTNTENKTPPAVDSHAEPEVPERLPTEELRVHNGSLSVTQLFPVSPADWRSKGQSDQLSSLLTFVSKVFGWLSKFGTNQSRNFELVTK